MALISQQNDLERIFFWDYLRTFVVVIVVLHHSALAYLAFVPYKWIVMDESKNIIFDFFAIINDPFLMPSLFLVSGYFSLYSLFKRGSSNFIKTRFDRLIIPFILGLFSLCPLIFYVRHLDRGESVGNYFNYWFFTYYQGEMHASHLWFLPILMAISLCFALGYALNPRLRKYLNTTEEYKYNLDKFNFKTLLLFGILTSLLFLSINLFIADAKWIEFGQKAIVRFQPTRIPLYFCYFAIGVITYKKQWQFVEIKYSLKTVLIWSIAALLLATTRLIFIYNFAPLLETSIFIKFINAFSHCLTCLSLTILSIVIFKTWFNKPSRWKNNLAANSYAIYIVHLPIVVLLQLTLKEIAVPASLKFAVVSTLSLLFSYLASEFFLRRLPLLRKIL